MTASGIYTLLTISMLAPIVTAHQNSLRRSALVDRDISGVSTAVCRTKYLLSTCKPSDHCSTGRICMDTIYRPCCEPASSECPTTVQLGFNCNVIRPTNWCRQNDDCRGKKCCPTGCGYNVCV